MRTCLFPAESKDKTSVDLEIVLVVVRAVVEGGREIVRLNEPDGEMAAYAEVYPSANMGGECICTVTAAADLRVNQASLGVGYTDQHLAERLPAGAA